MGADEVGLIDAWAEAEGWNPGVHDGPAFFAADPDGFFVGELGGAPACVSCFRYGDRFGFLGQYIVREDCRGRGFGLAVWRAGMDHLAGRCVGLDGVLAQVPNYERSGFRLAHHTTRFAGTGGGPQSAGLVSLREVPFDAIAEFDARCFPSPRTAFLRAWLTVPESVGLAAVAGERLAGYGVLRKSADGHKVGPLFADDAGTAIRLLAGLSATIPGAPFCIDVRTTPSSPVAGAWLKRSGWPKCSVPPACTRPRRPARSEAGVRDDLPRTRLKGSSDDVSLPRSDRPRRPSGVPRPGSGSHRAR
jgi:hypothetical protein